MEVKSQRKIYGCRFFEREEKELLKAQGTKFDLSIPYFVTFSLNLDAPNKITNCHPPICKESLRP